MAELQARAQAEADVPEVIVNNAGHGGFLFIDETDPAELTGMTDVRYHAAFFVTRAFIDGHAGAALGLDRQRQHPSAGAKPTWTL